MWGPLGTRDLPIVCRIGPVENILRFCLNFFSIPIAFGDQGPQGKGF